MKNEKIAKVLKESRKRNRLSVGDVVTRLANHSCKVAEKTVYGWESGQAQPDADTLLLLCEIYRINDILGAFGYTEDEPLHITAFEQDLIIRPRAHPEMRPAVKKLLDM